MNAFTTQIFAALVFAGSAAADGWDDFSNNLATDLAPIISLFGEQATKQYLSESITWLDYFIFAMAPIGILTALVSAIRVCGSSSLRAFIGRAKEGAGNVEAELLSSTSHDVCELYSRGGIARIFGRPKILEVVHDPNAELSEFEDEQSSSGTYTFDEYIRTAHGIAEWHEMEKFIRNRPPEEYAPNLSHNVGIKRPHDGWFVLVGILGFVLQGGVLCFAGTVTYLLKWEKNDAQPASYACPMAILGTVLVCGGVFSCAALVGESTKERVFTRTENPQRSLLCWIQPSQVLGDQTFGSFCYIDKGDKGSLRQYITSWKGEDKPPGLLVWLGVGISICGFVLQFVGLRGIHSSITMAQLGATLIMSLARSSLRTQRLDTEDNAFSRQPDLVKGYELDWLAFRISGQDLERSFGPGRECPVDGDLRWYSWKFCGMVSVGRRITDSTRLFGDQNSTAQARSTYRIMACRSRLAELTDSTPSQLNTRILSRQFETEMVSVREMARKLARAIELAANIVLRTTPRVTGKWREALSMSWAIHCNVSSTNHMSEAQHIEIPLNFLRSGQLPGDEWSLSKRHDVEAILGLWTWSLISDPATTWSIVSNPPGGPHKTKPRVFDPARDPSNLQRILCFDEAPDKMGFDYWLGRMVFEDYLIEASRESCIPAAVWQLQGAEERRDARIPVFVPYRETGETMMFLSRFFGWYAGEPKVSSMSSSSVDAELSQIWTVPTSCDIPSLCAQELLGVFVKSLLGETLDIGPVSVRETLLGPRLESQLVSDLVDAISETGLTSKNNAGFCVVPPIVFQAFTTNRTPLWYAAGDGHVGAVENLIGNQRFDMDLRDNEGRSPMWQAAANGHENIVFLLLESGADPNTADNAGVTPLAQAVANGHEDAMAMLLDGEADPKTADNTGVTPLAHAAANGHEGILNTLLENGADPNAADDAGVTPLARAVVNGHKAAVEMLLKFGADVDAADKSGKRPVAYALAKLRMDLVKILRREE